MSGSNTTPFLKRKFLETKLSALALEEAVTVPASTSLSEAVKLLAKNNFGCLLVSGQSGTLSGLISERDIITRAYRSGLDFSCTRVDAIVTAPPQTLPHYSSLGRALYSMSVGNFRHLPIIPRGGKPPLMLSVKDMVDYIYRKIARSTTTPQDEPAIEESAVSDFFVSPVAALKPHPPIQVQEHSTVHQAIDFFHTSEIGSVIVSNAQDRVCGIFTERDFIQRVAAAGRKPNETPIVDVMTHNPTTVRHNSSVSLAFSSFSQGRYRHLPIVNSNEKLLGILSVKNFVTALAQGILADLENK